MGVASPGTRYVASRRPARREVRDSQVWARSGGEEPVVEVVGRFDERAELGFPLDGACVSRSEIRGEQPPGRHHPETYAVPRPDGPHQRAVGIEDDSLD